LICANCQSPNDDGAQTCFGCGQPLSSLAAIRKGTVLANRYEVLSTLGKGGMGMVFKAHDRVLDEAVALKIMRSEAAENADMARRFRQEIKLARKVRHRNVCGIHEYGEVEGLRYISMEYIEGVDLRQILRKHGPPATSEAFEIAIQLCEGLQAIHDAGIIHRDLKTPNIMRDAKGVVRLMDFGIAKQFGEATLSGTALGVIIGTPEYMSPEQARGQKVDFRSDIYAVGIVIFEIFTGDVPFRGDTPLATIYKHLEETPTLTGPQGHLIPEPLLPVLLRALSKVPAERYESPSELGEAIAAARDLVLGPPGATSANRRPGSFSTGSSRSGIHAARAPASVPVQETPMPTAIPTQRPTTVVPAGTLLPTLSPGGGSEGAPTLLQEVGTATAPTIDHGRNLRAAPPTVAPPPPAVGPRDTGKRTGAWALAAVAAIVLGLAVWKLWPAPSPVPVPVAPASTAAAAPVVTGVLVVDAAPWGEVTSVVDESGQAAPLSVRYTPVMMVLAPGHYTVTVTNPRSARPQTLRAEVESGRRSTLRAEFTRVDVTDYFRQTGW
jgi:serine/threonine protein kinase